MKITEKMVFKGFFLWSALFTVILTYFSYTLFQKYILEKDSKYFKQITSFTKVGESISKIRVGSKHSRTYYNPCVVLKIEGTSTAIQACRKTKVVIRHRIEKDEAETMLKTRFASNASFTVYVSDDNLHAFLDPYTEEGEKDALFDFLILVAASIVMGLASILLWFYNPEKHKPLTIIKKKHKDKH